MMLATINLWNWLPVLVGGALAGGATALIGSYIVAMRIPFLGVCVAHAALAGAVFGALGGLTGTLLLIPALLAAVATALPVGMVDPRRIRSDSNIVIGVLFSLSMGLAFLGIGLFGVMGVSDNEVRNLLWGSVTILRWSDVHLMAGVMIVSAGFVILLAKEMRAVMFSRDHAAAAGVHVGAVWTAFLVLTALVLTVNFQAVGGLMIYALMTNPAVAAFQLVRGHGRAVALSAAMGAFSGVAGFLIAAYTDLPTGAMIVIVSSVLVVIAAPVGRVLHR
jgi:manganese/iron transport system permease protein